MNIRDTYTVDCSFCRKPIQQNSDSTIMRTGQIYIEEYRTDIAVGKPSHFEIMCSDCRFKYLLQQKEIEK